MKKTIMILLCGLFALHGFSQKNVKIDKAETVIIGGQQSAEEKADTTAIPNTITDSLPVVSVRDLQQLLNYLSPRIVNQSFVIVEQAMQQLVNMALNRELQKLQKLQQPK